jgi:hypothetical protein
MNHAKISHRDIAGAIISVVQNVAPLRYTIFRVQFWRLSIVCTGFVLFRMYKAPYGTWNSIWSLGPFLAFKASTDPVDTSTQAAFAPNQTEQEKSADTTFMVL